MNLYNFYQRSIGYAFAVCFLLFSFSPALADSFSNSGAVTDEHRAFLRLLYFHRPELAATYEFRNKVDEDKGSGSFEQQIFSAELEVPVYLNNSSFYTWGGGYQARMYEFGESSAEDSTNEILGGDDIFHKGFLKFGLGHFFSQDFFFSGYIQPGLYSNFGDGFDEEMLKLFSEGLLVYRINPGAQLLAGLRFSEDFDDSPLFPLLGLRLQDTEGRFHLSLTIPLELVLTWHLDRDSLIYIKGNIRGDQYFIESSGSNPSFNAQVQDRKLGVGTKRWFGSHVALGLELGATIESTFQFKTDLVGEFGEGDVENGLYLNAQLDYSF